MNAAERAEYLDDHHLVGRGWRSVVLEINEGISAIDPDYTILQVKEKFGGLRYYFELTEGLPQELWEKAERIVSDGEKKCYELCESCGTSDNVSTKPPTNFGWIRTLCHTCRHLSNRDD